LRQVFPNLIINAMEAMGGVTDRACLLRIQLEIHDAPAILLTVEGSGTGIDPKDLDRIFDTFFTIKSTGIGMRLSICRSIIEFHDGRLWAPPGVTRGRSFMSFCQKARWGRAW
jgi:signal transduction histidine kinase